MPNAQPLPRALPEDVGLPSSALSALLDALAASGQEIHSLMLLRRGKVAAEAWWKPHAAELPHSLYSLSKSFTSTAIGLLVGEGKLDVEAPVVDLLPEDAPTRPSKNLKLMRLRHLLTMSTGHTAETMDILDRSKSKNWARVILKAKVEREPGTLHVYNSGATYLLSAIAQRITGQRLLDYLTPRLFDPLGITGATWERCPRGIDTGGWGLSVTTEDIAKFGLLYLRKGDWNGRRILSPQWVEEATRSHITTDDRTGDWAQGYGYQFWRCRNGAYRGDGAFGQYCVVLPTEDAVLAMTSAAADMQAVLDAVWASLLPALRSTEPVKTVKKHQAVLRRALATRRLDPPVFLDHPAAAGVDGSTYVFDENPERLKSVSLTLQKGKLTVKLKGRRGAAYRCGAGKWASGKAKPMEGKDRTSYPVRAAYTWTADGRLEATVRLITTPHMMVYSFRLTDGGIEMSRRLNVGFRMPDPAPLKGRKVAP